MGGVAHGGKRVSRDKGLVIARKVLDLLGSAVQRAEVCGSIRRMKPEVGDVDIVLTGNGTLDEAIRGLFGSQKNGKPKRSGLVDGVQVDLNLSTPESWGAALMHCSGSKEWNIKQRAQAQALGFMLNQYGLWDGEKRLAGATEQEVYKALGAEFVKPENREC